MLDVVLDTNVLVSALRSKRGASQRVLRLVGTDALQIHISVALALEYEDVLKREGMLPGYTSAGVDEFLDYLFRVAILLPMVQLQRPTLRDPDDERILEVALQSGAMIVTHNVKDFRLAERLGVQIKRPGELLAMLGAVS